MVFMCFHDIPVLFWHVNKERNAELSAGESLTSSYLLSKSGDFSLQNMFHHPGCKCESLTFENVSFSFPSVSMLCFWPVALEGI